MTNFKFNDGGRKAAGFKGEAGDCVCRAIAIASGRPYKEIFDRLAEGNVTQRRTSRQRKKLKATADDGIYTTRKWFKDYMTELGFVWKPIMSIGSGCTTHLRHDELPKSGRLVLHLSKHSAAYVDGVLNDTYDCSREGTRCVYGYWELVQPEPQPEPLTEATKPNNYMSQYTDKMWVVRPNPIIKNEFLIWADFGGVGMDVLICRLAGHDFESEDDAFHTANHICQLHNSALLS